MSKYDEITKARTLLELPESATMKEIKANYRRLVRRWHPDKCREDPELSSEMTNRLNEAYRLIVSYCSQYRYSFAADEVIKYLSGHEWWIERFGNDPIWGNMKK